MPRCMASLSATAWEWLRVDKVQLNKYTGGAKWLVALCPARVLRRLAIKPVELKIAHQVCLRYKGGNRTAHKQ